MTLDTLRVVVDILTVDMTSVVDIILKSHTLQGAADTPMVVMISAVTQQEEISAVTRQEENILQEAMISEDIPAVISEDIREVVETSAVMEDTKLLLMAFMKCTDLRDIQEAVISEDMEIWEDMEEAAKADMISEVI